MMHIFLLQSSSCTIFSDKLPIAGNCHACFERNATPGIPDEYRGTLIQLMHHSDGLSVCLVCVWFRQTVYSSVILEGQCAYPPTTTITTPLEFAPQGYNRLIFQILFFQSCQQNHHSLVLMAVGREEITTTGASLSTAFNLAKQQQALKHNNMIFYNFPKTLH